LTEREPRDGTAAPDDDVVIDGVVIDLRDLPTPVSGVEVVRPGDPVFAEAETLEAEVFEAMYGVDSRAEYRKYRSASLFHVARQGSEIVAVMRVIVSGPAGFKTLNEFRDVLYPSYAERLARLDPARIVEVGTVAASPRARTIRAARYAQRVYSSALQQLYLCGVEAGIASTDIRVLAMLRDWFDFQIHDIGETVAYLGSPTTPVVLWLQEQYDHYAAQRPDLLRRFFVGEFLDIREAERLGIESPAERGSQSD
jgi:hypothetical protein